MLVARTTRQNPTFVFAKGTRQKSSLLDHPLGTPIADCDASTKRLLDELLESIHLLRLAAQVVVETKDLDHQTWGIWKGRSTAMAAAAAAWAMASRSKPVRTLGASGRRR